MEIGRALDHISERLEVIVEVVEERREDFARNLPALEECRKPIGGPAE